MPPYKKAKNNKNNNNNNNKNKANTPCKYFQLGKCSNPRCPYLHVRAGGSSSKNDRKENSGNSAGDLLSTMLKLFFEKNQATIFRAEESHLNLSGLTSYPDLQPVASSINFNTRTFCEALCRCVRDLIVPAPSTLSMENNSITSFFHMAKSLEDADLHHSIRALSLANNQIKGTDIASELKNFKQLVELNLPKNPVVDAKDYKEKVKKFLPSLLCLDGNSICAAPLALPWPKFYGEDNNASGSTTANTNSTPTYDDTQRNILQFIQTSILTPLERDRQPGVASGVDAVSDVYDVNSTLTLSFSTPDAAVSMPQRAAGGYNNCAHRNEAIREIVGFRMRQTQSDHNILRGIKSTQVAIGRTKVCAQLEHWLYPKNFSVGHYIHSSPDVVVLNNMGFGPNAVVGMKVPLSVVTMHGVMTWWYRPQNNASFKVDDAVVIKRNFSRVFTVSSNEAGRWHVMNDMVSLYPFTGTDTDDDCNAVPVLTMEKVLFKGLNPYDVVFSPATDPNRATRLGRKHNVPETVVLTLCRYMQSDLELMCVLADLSGVPMHAFEQCAALVNMDPLAAAWLCRLGNRHGIAPETGVTILQQCGMNWEAIMAAVAARGAAA